MFCLSWSDELLASRPDARGTGEVACEVACEVARRGKTLEPPSSPALVKIWPWTRRCGEASLQQHADL